MKGSVTLHSLLTLPLAGGRFRRYEKERKAPGFLDSRLAAEAVPSLVVCKTDGSAGYRSTVFVADAANPAQSWLLPMAASSGRPIKDLQKAVYAGEDGVTNRNVFITAPDNVEDTALANGVWLHSRSLLDHLGQQDMAMFGLALSMLNWVSNVRHCQSCGGSLVLRDYGTSQRCSACDAPHYPAINPAMIVCVLDGRGNVLLSQRRQTGLPAAEKVFRTILAGFVSHGESMEETVSREVMEESGARVSWIRYVGSQPWPFPHQLMTCYYALVEDSESLTAEEQELVSVGWVPKEDVRRAMAGEHPDYTVPPPYTAAHMLLSAWVEGRVNDRGEDVTTSP